MKKITAIVSVIAATTLFCTAQNTTRIGDKHAVNFGSYYGYSTGRLTNFAGGFMDINARNNNLRTRLTFEVEQVAIAFCPAASVELMYMTRLTDGLYLYPFAGAEAEYHNDPAWGSTFDYAPQGGLGLEYQFCSNFGLFLQGRYRYGINAAKSYMGGQAGIVFAFGNGKNRASAARGSSAKAEEARLAAQKAAEDKAAADKAAAAEAEAARIAAQKAAADKAAAEAEAARIAAIKKAEAEAASRVSAHNITFPLGSSFVDEAGRAQIAEVVELLQKYTDAVVEIKGYADKETGKSDVNMTLSRKRAEAVKTFFTSAGIPEQNIKLQYFGDTVAPFNSAEANRVVTVTTK